jgi:hypothetical protein
VPEPEPASLAGALTPAERALGRAGVVRDLDPARWAGQVAGRSLGGSVFGSPGNWVREWVMAGSGSGGRMLTVASAALLVATEAVATAVAAGWAVAGLFRLGDIGLYVLVALFGAAALYVSWIYLKKARVAEASLAE